jgi:hypothetical protein
VGCQHVPYTQTEVETLCLQLNNGWSTSTDCIYCNPLGKLCNQASATGGACTNPPPTSTTTPCGQCNTTNMPAVCDTTVVVACPAPP